MTAPTLERVPPAPPTPPDEVLLGFARALRAAGVAVTADREAGFLAAVAAVGLEDERATYWAGRATLTGSPDDIERYDQVFTAWFTHRLDAPSDRPRPPAPTVVHADLGDDDGASDGPGEEEQDVVQATASGTELLRHRDVASLSPAEKAVLDRLFATLPVPAPVRRAVRATPSSRGRLDPRRTLRRQLRTLGEPTDLAWRRRTTRPRRVVLLLDVSGSMSAYADSLLRVAHHWVRATEAAGGRGGVEVFTMGTRLTHVTRALRQRDPDRALEAAGDVVPDWSGGTRLGETLKAFLDRWGSAAPPAAPSSSCAPTAGSEAAPSCSPSRWPGCRPSRTASCGSTRTAGRTATCPSSRASSPRCRTATTSWRGTRCARTPTSRRW